MDERDYFWRNIPDSEPLQFVGMLGFAIVALLTGAAFGYVLCTRIRTRRFCLALSAVATNAFLSMILFGTLLLGIVPLKEAGLNSAIEAMGANALSLVLLVTIPAVAGAEMGRAVRLHRS